MCFYGGGGAKMCFYGGGGGRQNRAWPHKEPLLLKSQHATAYTVAENNTKMSAALRSTLLMTSIGSSIKDVCYDILIMHNRRLWTPVMRDLVT